MLVVDLLFLQRSGGQCCIDLVGEGVLGVNTHTLFENPGSDIRDKRGVRLGGKRP